MGYYKLGYWQGWSMAKLNSSYIECAWKTDVQVINFINNVFAFWYKARSTLSPYRSYIGEILDDAGTAGWGSGLPDLKSVFDHLEKNYGYWSGEYCMRSTYWGGGPKSLFFYNPIDVPEAFANFAAVIEEKLGPLKEYCSNFFSDTYYLFNAFRQGNWIDAGKRLDNIATYSTRAQLILWLEPKARTYLSYPDALNNIHAGLTAYAYSADIGALRYAVSFVPVLGNYYAAMVEMIPNAKTWFSGVIDRYCEKIDEYPYQNRKY